MAGGPGSPGPWATSRKSSRTSSAATGTRAGQLLPLVYDELRKLAAARLAHEAPGQSLQATALVHEAYLRLVGPIRTSPSTAAATSSPRRPRRCAASWSTGHATASG